MQSNDFNALPFPIGSTAGVTGSTDMAQWEGREFVVKDLDYSANPAKARAFGQTGNKTIRCVRNVSGVSLLPRMLVTYKSANYGCQVDGYARTTAVQVAGVVDEFLVSTGVANNDLFWIVVDGPAEVKTSAAANAEDVFSAGSLLVALTAAASTVSTTAGRVSAQDLTGATAVLAVQVQNLIGVAMSASTTSNTDSGKLCRIVRKF